MRNVVRVLRCSSVQHSKPVFRWEDPLNLDLHLTEEELVIRDAARNFASKELAPRVLEAARYEKYDDEVFRAFGRAGLYAPTLTGYGIRDEAVSSVANGLISQEIEYVDSAYRSMWSVQSSLVMYPIHKFGNEETKNAYLPGLASGDLIGCFGLTEPDAGSDPSSMRTVAKKVGGEWVLNGTKMWISNSPSADVFVVWAVADCPDDKARNGKVVGFVLDKKMKGIAAPRIEGKLSLRAGPTGYITMDDVKVPDANRLSSIGLGGPFACLASARMGIAAGVLGAGKFCLAATREYALNRRMFGMPIAGKQLVQEKLANMATELALADAACILAGRNKDAGQLTHEAISILKRNSTGKVREICKVARSVPCPLGPPCRRRTHARAHLCATYLRLYLICVYVCIRMCVCTIPTTSP